jgi:sugar/nucleoside kinase (ribokinase family)
MLPRPARLLSVGSIIADVRMEVPYLPERGGDVLGSAASINAGGGFNILAAAARNGLPSVFAGRHGCGPFGSIIREELAREGIGTLLPLTNEGDSGFCIVLVEPDGERTFVTSPGVESRGERSLADIRVEASDAVFVSGYDLGYPELGPAIARWLADIPSSILLVVDPGPLVGAIPQEILDAVLPRIDVLTLNRREAGILVGGSDIGPIGERVLPRMKTGGLVVIRDGAAGCVIEGGSLPSAVSIPAPRVQMIDSTGAGDAHTGVLIAALAKGLDPVSAAQRANAAAAISVTHRGPAMAPTEAELDAFLKSSQRSRDPREPIQTDRHTKTCAEAGP